MSYDLQQLRTIISTGLAASVTESMGTLTLGFRALSGREMPVYVERLASGQLLLSDGGETWMDLVSESYSPAAPSQPDERRLSALAALYGLNWHRRALVAVCDDGDVLDAARRLTMAAAAVDAWRVWAPEPILAKPRVVAGVGGAIDA